jgi:hypothetical protein
MPGFAMTRWRDKRGAPVAGACDGSAASAARARRITEHPVLCGQGIDRHQGISFIYGGEDVKHCYCSVGANHLKKVDEALRLIVGR